jgi:hypothetical protein
VRNIGAFVLLALVAACAMVGPVAPTKEAAPPAPALVSGKSSSAEELVEYLSHLRGLSDSALAAEASRHRKEATDLSRVKAALALSLSGQAEESEILALVDPAARRENADRDVKAMASFLQALATERRKLKENAAAAGRNLREEKRAAEAQKQRADTLQQKLDALTDLEKSLADRQTTNR